VVTWRQSAVMGRTGLAAHPESLSNSRSPRSFQRWRYLLRYRIPMSSWSPSKPRRRERSPPDSPLPTIW